jgi:hypothetical protein
MTVEAFRTLPPPIPPVPPWREMPPLSALQPASPGFDPALQRADPREVDFALDPQSVRITDENEGQWNTSYTASGEMRVSAPGADPATVPVRYEVTIRNEDATPAQMREVNPFDPGSIPPRTRIEVYGRDYAGTPLEASFRALAEANDLTSIDDLRLSLEMTGDGELRVMTGANRLFDAPRDGGPASAPAEREDFTRHTSMLADPAGADRAGYSAMLLHGTFPDGTLGTVEDVDGDTVHGIMTESGSGEVNDVVWTLDDQGRPTEAEATLTWEPGSGGRDSDRIEANAQSRFRVDNDMKGTGDDVGHMIAYRFVNGHGPVNMFPQFGLFNRGPYARMEQEWSDWLANGMEVRISVDLVPNDVQRPSEVHVDYQVIDPASGNVVYDPFVIAFENADGQRFDPIAESRMDDMIEAA